MAEHGHGPGRGRRMRELLAKPELCLPDRRRNRPERFAGEAEPPEPAVEQAVRVVLAVGENVAGDEAPKPVENRLREGVGTVDLTGLYRRSSRPRQAASVRQPTLPKIRRTAYFDNAPADRRCVELGRRRRHVRIVVIVLALAVLATAVPAAASRGRAAGTLELAGGLRGPSGGVDCPQGAPDGADCWAINATGAIRGLGAVSESGVLVVQGAHTTCEMWQSTPVLTVAGKGTIDLSVHNPACIDGSTSTGFVNAPQVFTVTGGTGAYTGASGSGTVITSGMILVRRGDTLAGTIVAPAATFDLAPPVISGATAKLVRLRKGKRGVRVRYAVTARDDVDGPVPVTCMPVSGSLFGLGRTHVTCTATDASANTATAGFTITAKR